VQAAAYMQATGLSADAFRRRFEEKKMAAFDEEEELDDYKTTIRTTWSMAIDQSKDHPLAAAVLAVCSWVAAEDIPRELFSKWSQAYDDNDILRAIRVLRQFALLDMKNDSLYVHGLVQTVVRERNGDESLGATLSLLSRSLRNDVFNLTNFQRLQPHALAALAHFSTRTGITPDVAAHVADQVATYRRLRANLEKFKTLYEDALRLAEATHGLEHPHNVRDLNNLGSILNALGDFSGARSAFERALSIDEEVHGPDHPDVGISAMNLGSALSAQGDNDSAILYFERAYHIFRTRFGDDHQRTISAKRWLDRLT
jgi:tetratricopeptide (TPR) repeat protein